jgi:hypothetical protein
MTREWRLEEHEGVYCEKIQRESQGDLVDYYRKTLCAAFVKLLVSGRPFSHKSLSYGQGASRRGVA